MGKKLQVVAGLGLVLALAVGIWFQWFVVDDPEWEASYVIRGSAIKFKRRGPIMEMWGNDQLDFAKALGYVHARDRLVQLVLQRTIAEGRLSENLLNDPKTVKMDLFFRELGFERDARRAMEERVLGDEVNKYLQAYADGINFYMEEQKEKFWFDFLALPLEFTLVNYKPAPWQPHDTLTTLKLMCYIGLASLQGDVEKFLIQSIKGGVDLNKLKAIFAPRLDNMPDEVVELIKKLHIEEPMISSRFLEGGGPFSFPAFSASNNWVIGPSLTKDGSPIQCNDPHLEINRLPGVWYEILFHFNNKPDEYWFGVTVPGVPGVVMGRSGDVTWGFTYGFMDQLDYFIEEVRDGKYKRLNEEGKVEWKDFNIRREVIKPKGTFDPKQFYHVSFYENENGILEISNSAKLGGAKIADGYHLVRAWSWGAFSAQDFQGLIPPPYFRSAEETRQTVKGLALSTNFLFTDSQGNIGYQQTGRMPKRGPKHNGLLPAIGWLADYRWNGSVNPDQLTSFLNPPQGWIATANDDWQSPDETHPISITISMGPNRRDRADEMIRNLKDKGIKITPEHMKEMQQDLHSKEAEAYMKILRPLLPSTVAGEVLKHWDLRYNKDSRGAVLFERFWERVLTEVYGNWTFGHDTYKELRSETGFLLAFHWYFDRPILSEPVTSNGIETVNGIAWFGKEGREGVFRRIANELFGAAAIANITDIPTYGEYHNMTLKNILFDGQLPIFTGFDYGPIPLEGNRNTLVQGNIFKMLGRQSSFAPTYRFISEVMKHEALTSLPSGPSGRRFSSLYLNPSYFNGGYTLTPLKGK